MLLKRIGIGTAFLILLFLTALQLDSSGRWNSEPSYKGKSLDDWLEPTFQRERGGAYSSHLSTEFEKAMQHMGTNAIPRLLAMIRSKDYPGTRSYLWNQKGPFSTWLLSSRNDWFLMITGFNRPLVRRQRARAGFKALGPIATNAIPELLAIPSGQGGDSESYGVIDAMGSAAFDSIAAQIRSPSEWVKIRVIIALASKHFKERGTESLEILQRCLTDENSKIRRIAAYQIGHISVLPSPSTISALEHLAMDSDTNVVREAAASLKDLKTRSHGSVQQE